MERQKTPVQSLIDCHVGAESEYRYFKYIKRLDPFPGPYETKRTSSYKSMQHRAPTNTDITILL